MAQSPSEKISPAFLAPMADAEASIEANRLAAQARRAAKNEPVDFDLEAKFNEVVHSGGLEKEMLDAFSFTQALLAALLGCICLQCI